MILTDGIANIINDEYDYLGMLAGDTESSLLENQSELVVIYGGEFNGENIEEDFMYHVGIKGQNLSWTDKDDVYQSRSNMRFSRNIMNYSNALAGNKQRLYYKRKEKSNQPKTQGKGVKITDSKEIEEILKILKQQNND